MMVIMLYNGWLKKYQTLGIFHPQSPGRQAKKNETEPFSLFFACLKLELIYVINWKFFVAIVGNFVLQLT